MSGFLWGASGGEAVGWLGLALKRRFVLASASPRRSGLLTLLGIPFEVRPSNVEEKAAGGTPREMAAALAKAKAEAVVKAHGGGLVLGGDTEVVMDGETLGKPSGTDEALAMLLRLRGRTHEVLTGLHLIDAPTGESVSAVESTLVTMRDFSEGEAAAYARGGDPLDKAGAYGIQGPAALLVSRIEGCFYNVVGLPLSRLVEMMEELHAKIQGANE
jgi:septum formation protein